MRVNPNSEPSGVTGIPGRTAARNQRLGQDKLSVTTAEKLNNALELTPAVRTDKVNEAKSLVQDVSYPPPELIRKISALFVGQINAKTGTEQAQPE